MHLCWMFGHLVCPAVPRSRAAAAMLDDLHVQLWVQCSCPVMTFNRVEENSELKPSFMNIEAAEPGGGTVG